MLDYLPLRRHTGPGKNSLSGRSHYFILTASNGDTRLQRRRNVACQSNHSRLLHCGYSVHGMRRLFRRRAELLAAYLLLWSHRILIRKAAHFYVKLSGKLLFFGGGLILKNDNMLPVHLPHLSNKRLQICH